MAVRDTRRDTVTGFPRKAGTRVLRRAAATQALVRLRLGEGVTRSTRTRPDGSKVTVASTDLEDAVPLPQKRARAAAAPRARFALAMSNGRDGTRSEAPVVAVDGALLRATGCALAVMARRVRRRLRDARLCFGGAVCCAGSAASSSARAAASLRASARRVRTSPSVGRASAVTPVFSAAFGCAGGVASQTPHAKRPSAQAPMTMPFTGTVCVRRFRSGSLARAEGAATRASPERNADRSVCAHGAAGASGAGCAGLRASMATALGRSGPGEPLATSAEGAGGGSLLAFGGEELEDSGWGVAGDTRDVGAAAAARRAAVRVRTGLGGRDARSAARARARASASSDAERLDGAAAGAGSIAGAAGRSQPSSAANKDRSSAGDGSWSGIEARGAGLTGGCPGGFGSSPPPPDAGGGRMGAAAGGSERLSSGRERSSGAANAGGDADKSAAGGTDGSLFSCGSPRPSI